MNYGSILQSIPNIGDSIYTTMKDNIESIKRTRYAMGTITYKTKKASAKTGEQLTFVITGSLFRGTRDYYAEKIADAGHKLSGSVSKKTNYLVTNETTQTTKRQKAEELGIPIIDEEEFISIMTAM